MISDFSGVPGLAAPCRLQPCSAAFPHLIQGHEGRCLGQSLLRVPKSDSRPGVEVYSSQGPSSETWRGRFSYSWSSSCRLRAPAGWSLPRCWVSLLLGRKRKAWLSSFQRMLVCRRPPEGIHSSITVNSVQGIWRENIKILHLFISSKWEWRPFRRVLNKENIPCDDLYLIWQYFIAEFYFYKMVQSNFFLTYPFWQVPLPFPLTPTTS